jgi:hypothetical protein
MRTSYLCVNVMVMTFLLNGCYTAKCPPQGGSNCISRHATTPLTNKTGLAKNPEAIAFFHNEKKVLTPYRIIGIATVSKYNLIGKKRKEATMHDLLKQFAASMGGDALIHIDKSKNAMQAHVIAYQKILI